MASIREQDEEAMNKIQEAEQQPVAGPSRPARAWFPPARTIRRMDAHDHDADAATGAGTAPEMTSAGMAKPMDVHDAAASRSATTSWAGRLSSFFSSGSRGGAAAADRFPRTRTAESSTTTTSRHRSPSTSKKRKGHRRRSSVEGIASGSNRRRGRRKSNEDRTDDSDSDSLVTLESFGEREASPSPSRDAGGGGRRRRRKRTRSVLGSQTQQPATASTNIADQSQMEGTGDPGPGILQMHGHDGGHLNIPAIPPPPDAVTASRLAEVAFRTNVKEPRKSALRDSPGGKAQPSDIKVETAATGASLSNAPPGATGALVGAARTKQRHLQFAPEQKRVRRKYLPPDYVPGEVYRSLDEFVRENRALQRTSRRAGMGMGSGGERSSGRSGKRSRSRRGSKSSAASSSSTSSSDAGNSGSSSSSSSSSSDSDSSSSSSSSSSSEGAHGLTLARLRAFFGDSSSSSSSSSSGSSSSDSSSSSSSRSVVSDSDGTSITSSRSGRSSSKGGNHRYSRNRRSNRKRKGPRSRRSASHAPSLSDFEDAAPPVSPAILSRTPVIGPFAERTRRRNARATRNRNRKAAAIKRAKAREKQLIEQGVLPPKPSKMARHKAKRAREEAGAVTEYTMFTPVALPLPLPGQPLPMPTSSAEVDTLGRPALGSRRQTHHHQVRSGAGPATGGANAEAVSGAKNAVYFKTGAPGKVMQTVSFLAVKQQLYALRAHRRQQDAAAGDLAGAEDARREKKGADAAAGAAPTAGGSAESKDVASEEMEELDPEDGDLALPPPALDLDQEVMLPEPAGDAEEDRFGARGPDLAWHMSDMPLTPHTKFTLEFAKGFSVAPRKRASSDAAEAEESLATRAEMIGEADARDALPLRDVMEGEGDDEEDKEKLAHNAKIDPVQEQSRKERSPKMQSEGESGGAWWLDVSYPTYRDMVELSKMFPLHPLTVEDVLQQEPREKVDVFDRLGYYFVVLRALDERYFRYTSGSAANSAEMMNSKASTNGESTKVPASEKDTFEMKELFHDTGDPATRSPSSSERTAAEPVAETQPASGEKKRPRVDLIEGLDGKEGVEGVSVGAVNIYLVVFSHGVISFHFDDVGKHTNHVRKRLVELPQPVDLTSDWIAHGIYDSVVDAFFPLLSYIETELEDLELQAGDPIDPSTKTSDVVGDADEVYAIAHTARGGKDKLPFTILQTKRTRLQYALRGFPFIHLSLSIAKRLPQAMVVQTYLTNTKIETSLSLIDRVRYGRVAKELSKLQAFKSRTALEQSELLRRITKTRKIATGILRLLHPKNDAIRGLRKRLGELRTNSLARTEVFIYLSDVHDHILALLYQLQSNETHLGDLHYAYLASINIYNRRIRQHTDRKLIGLATIATTVLALVFISSIFSFNVTIPANAKPGPDYWWFGIVIAIQVTCASSILVWRSLMLKRSHQKMQIRRAAR